MEDYTGDLSIRGFDVYRSIWEAILRGSSEAVVIVCATLPPLPFCVSVSEATCTSWFT